MRIKFILNSRFIGQKKRISWGMSESFSSMLLSRISHEHQTHPKCQVEHSFFPADSVLSPQLQRWTVNMVLSFSNLLIFFFANSFPISNYFNAALFFPTFIDFFVTKSSGYRESEQIIFTLLIPQRLTLLDFMNYCFITHLI
jgi:hypothetical protein